MMHNPEISITMKDGIANILSTQTPEHLKKHSKKSDYHKPFPARNKNQGLY